MEGQKDNGSRINNTTISEKRGKTGWKVKLSQWSIDKSFKRIKGKCGNRQSFGFISLPDLIRCP